MASKKWQEDRPSSSSSSQQSAMDADENHKALVKQSWDLMRADIEKHSNRFFASILDNIPEAKDMFYFLKSSEDAPQNNQKLKTHALVLFKLTCNSAIRLQEEGDIAVPDDALRRLGSIHLERGVKDSHFEVMREALLTTVREAAGDHWSDGLGMAWAVAYDKLAFEIKRKMKE